MHNKNKATITKHILVVAREKQSFRLINLISAYWFAHHTDEWQERLDSLAARQILINVGNSYSLKQ